MSERPHSLPDQAAPVVTIDASSITDWPSFHTAFAEAFGFPEFYGRNMDAWIDCMSSLDAPGDGLSHPLRIGWGCHREAAGERFLRSALPRPIQRAGGMLGLRELASAGAWAIRCPRARIQQVSVVLKRLLHVEQSFLINGRGLVVTPFLPETEEPRSLRLRLERPDGTSLECRGRIEIEFSVPSGGAHSVLVLADVPKADVPAGTVIFTDER